YNRDAYASRLDPGRLDALDSRVAAVARRAESLDRNLERRLAAQRDDREIEIGTLIDQRKSEEAKRKLEFYADNRLLSPGAIERLRKEIYNPPVERASDPAVAGRILLDVE